MRREIAYHLDIVTGNVDGRTIPIERDKPLCVGRRAAGYSSPEDVFLSAEHFEIFWDGETCRLLDLGSANGTYVGGDRVATAILRGGEEIRAGNAAFRVRREETGAEPSRAETVRMLSGSQPLYAVLDAARTPRILELLALAGEEYGILYDGPSAIHLAAVAPYLVRLPEKSRLLRRLLREGWGQAWGVYVVANTPFEDLRKHLRHFLIVQGEDGEGFYFRFYDPRVLRAFLPACTAEERTRFFGHIQAFLTESDGSDTIQQFTPKEAAS
jgi:hypothetical protein